MRKIAIETKVWLDHPINDIVGKFTLLLLKLKWGRREPK